MGLFEQPQYLVTPPKTGAYTAQEGEFVLVDTLLGNVTITAPANPVNGDVFAVKKITDDIFFVTVAGNGANMETPFSIEISGPSVVFFGDGATAEWIYDDGVNAWFCKTSQKIPPYIEVWAANDIIDLAGTVTLVYTFVPIFTGQTNEILTHAAGTFTEQISGAFNMGIDSLITYNSSGNNVDAEVSVGFSPSAQITALRFYNSFFTSRSGVFRNSAKVDGVLNANPGQQFTTNAIDEASSAQMTLDITGTLFLIST